MKLNVHIYILLILLSNFVFFQNNHIAGRIVDEQMNGLPGAMVTNLKSHQQVVTGALGIYQISASMGDTLTYKFVGLTEEKRVVINISNRINVVLINKTVNDLGGIWTRKQWRKAENRINNCYKKLEDKAQKSGKWNY